MSFSLITLLINEILISQRILIIQTLISQILISQVLIIQTLTITSLSTPIPEPSHGPLPKNYTIDFRCDNFNTTPKFLLCDGVNDCGDNSDESGTTCLVHCAGVDSFFCQVDAMDKKTECIHRNLYCLGYPYCLDGSDQDSRFCAENLCDNHLNITHGYCGRNGKCIADMARHTGPFKKCVCNAGFSGKRCQDGAPSGSSTMAPPITPTIAPSTSKPTAVPTTKVPKTKKPKEKGDSPSTAVTISLSLIGTLILICILSVLYLKSNDIRSKLRIFSRSEVMQLRQDEIN